MVHLVRIPIRRVQVVAFEAVGGEACLGVVRVGGCVEISEVAVHAKVAIPPKLHRRFRDMALRTAHHPVYAREREAVVEVQFLDIVHQPVVDRVAAGAVVPRCLLVDVEVAGIAVRFCTLKHQCFVAIPAFNRCVATLQGEVCFVVVEKGRVNWYWHPGGLGFGRFLQFNRLPMRCRNLPPRRRVASGAVQLQSCAVRVLREHVCRQTEQEGDGRKFVHVLSIQRILTKL